MFFLMIDVPLFDIEILEPCVKGQNVNKGAIITVTNAAIIASTIAVTVAATTTTTTTVVVCFYNRIQICPIVNWFFFY